MKKNLTNQYVITIISITLLLVMASSTAYAAIPQKINYQGYLTDPQGTTIDTTVSIVFSLYSQSSGGTALWTETQTVTVTDGVFSTDLGDTTPITLPFDTPYYLGTSIGSDSEMTPRQPLTSVGYAFRAKEADSVKDNAVTTAVIADDAVITDKVADDAISGDKIAPATITSSNIANGAVGSSQIGDGAIATEDLTDDAVTVDKLFPNVISSINGITNDGGNVALEPGSNITIIPDDDANTITIATTGGGNSLWTESGGNVYRDSGNVGIGTTNPQAKLSFGADLLTPRKIALWDEVNNFYGLGLFPGQLTFLTNDTEKMTILDNGNVGIGTLFPDNKLTVTSQGPLDAVRGRAENGAGVLGRSKGSVGVYGESESSDGVRGYSVNGNGVYGKSTNGYSGYFSGKVKITGNLEKSGGQFKIDHPLEPENKYLSHSFVESPDMMNVYNGNVLLNKQGEAWVELPVWFEALNRDFRYQLTPVGAPAPNLYVAEKITDNRFKIEGGTPQMEVSWQVTGIRQDVYARAHPINVEEEKPPEEQGYYLYPELYGQTEEKGIEWARNPERMQRMKARGKNKNQPNS